MDEEIKAYENAENFKLIYRCNIDFGTYTPSAQSIEYLAPDATVPLEWAASKLIGSEATGDIYHDFGTGADKVPASGDYLIRGKLTINAKVVYCKPRIFMIGKFSR